MNCLIFSADLNMLEDGKLLKLFTAFSRDQDHKM